MLAQRIVAGEVPDLTQEIRLTLLIWAPWIAGASSASKFEERLRSVRQPK